MSVTKNTIIIIVKVVEDHLWRRTYTRKGKALEFYTNLIWMDALCLLSLAWYDLIPTEDYTTPRWLKPWLQAIATTDVADVVRAFKCANDILIESINHLSNYETFKQFLKASGCRVDLVSPTKVLIDRWYLYRDPADFKRLRTCFSFITRLTIPGQSDLEVEARARYVATESSLISDPLEREKEIIEKWFPLSSKDYLIEHWHPKHGPGSTADNGRISLIKYENFKTDDMVRRLDLLLGGNTMPYTPVKKLDRVAKVVFVPKAVDKLRTICMEPSTLQWYQQGFSSSINDYMRDHAYLRRRINLEDQTLSRELAYLGSIDGELSTIDLSDASDRVSWDLIRIWSRRSSLLPFLWMTRSRAATIGRGTVMASKKFAPMGSALCFPIECIVFAAIVEASIQAVGGSARDSSFRVYGDDIIVETRYANEVIRRLTENGFVVNTSKSFYRKETHNFRESCGGEFLDGIDVCPIRLSRKFAGLSNGSTENASLIAELVDACNSFYTELPSVRRYIIWDLMLLPKEKRPVFDHSGEIGIFSPTPTNFHLPKPKYVKRYQQWYLRHGALKDMSKGHNSREDLALFEHLRATANRQNLSSPEDKVSVALDREPRLRWSVMKTAVDQVTNPCDYEDKKRGG